MENSTFLTFNGTEEGPDVRKLAMSYMMYKIGKLWTSLQFLLPKGSNKFRNEDCLNPSFSYAPNAGDISADCFISRRSHQ